MTDLEVLGQMASENGDIGMVGGSNISAMNEYKKYGAITVGFPVGVVTRLMNNEIGMALYTFKWERFNELKGNPGLKEENARLREALEHVLWMSEKWGREWFDKPTWDKLEQARAALKT